MSTTAVSNRHPIALITGGSRGLGRNTALHLARKGSDVVITYRERQAEALAVVAEIQAMGRLALALPLDVGRCEGLPAFGMGLGKAVDRQWHRKTFDHLVNNAGGGINAGLADTTEAQFDELVNVHLKGVFFLTQTLLPLISDGGRIVNVSSGLARFVSPGKTAYGAVKGAVEVLTRYMAAELGPRGIAVNVVAPGAIATDFGGGVVRDNPQVNAMIAAHTALGRVGEPDDIGGVIASLLQPDNRWINAQRIEVSGGMNL
jgi:NAD(P)-dependent dehydrogenase (short-subunit alcohol dehydrogenase family)